MDGENELRTIYDLEAKLTDVSLPFEEIVPAAVKEGPWNNSGDGSVEMKRRVMACSITSLRVIPTLPSASKRPTYF